VPYRIDLRDADDSVLDRLVELGALDVERTHDDGTAALMPDSIAPNQIASALGVGAVTVSAAAGRDADSVWVLGQRPICIGRVRIVPANGNENSDGLTLIDASAFGTGLHPTTALCLEALDEAVDIDAPDAVLDVGTGSGVLALAALTLGVPRARGIDVDDDALRVAAENARLNRLSDRFHLSRGGPDTLTGAWPLTLANVQAAPLMEMAPSIVRRVGHKGRLVLSGIPSSVEHEVDDAYRRLGMRRMAAKARAGWVALVFMATW
jgi:ribosomal protein L11 methyltransferase